MRVQGLLNHAKGGTLLGCIEVYLEDIVDGAGKAVMQVPFVCMNHLHH